MAGAREKGCYDGGDDGADDAVVDGELCDGGVCHSLGEGEEGYIECCLDVVFDLALFVFLDGVSNRENFNAILGEEFFDGGTGITEGFTNGRHGALKSLF